MTEAEWQVSGDPMALLRYLGANKSGRKQQLFCLACWGSARAVFEDDGDWALASLEESPEKDWCAPENDMLEQALSEVEDALYYQFWDLNPGDEYTVQHMIAEGRESSLTSWNALSIHAGTVLVTTAAVATVPPEEATIGVSGVHLCSAAEAARRGEIHAAAAGAQALAQWRTYQRFHADLVREVFGNPFRPLRVVPGWLTWNDGTVCRLAQAIYEEKAFDRMPILADALEEAGCSEALLVDHCRRGTTHVQGCWVLDLLVDKE
jgi:hypothetical protein